MFCRDRAYIACVEGMIDAEGLAAKAPVSIKLVASSHNDILMLLGAVAVGEIRGVRVAPTLIPHTPSVVSEAWNVVVII